MENKNEEVSEQKPEGEEKEMIKRVGQILNEDGEWVEHVEMDDPDRPPIAYDIMGSEGLPIEADDEVVDFCMQYRIPKIEGLTECKGLKKLGLRKNLIKKIEGIENNTQLVELELYDNRIAKLENINHLQNLVFLDMAFNVIKEITPGSLDGLVNLKKIYLSANKIKKMQGLEKLVNLEVLDIGDNRIRQIEGIETLTGLKELHLAKNKIQKIENIGHLKNLYMLTL